MAYGNPGFYPATDEEPKSTEGTEAPKGGEDEQDEGQTALLPKSILAGKKFEPGEEVVLKIVHIYDDEVEVEYSHDESAEEEEPAGGGGGGESPTMSKAMNSMSEY